jgi:hypothetical protein
MLKSEVVKGKNNSNNFLQEEVMTAGAAQVSRTRLVTKVEGGLKIPGQNQKLEITILFFPNSFLPLSIVPTPALQDK